MKFYDREKELSALEQIYSQCKNTYGKITVLTGRRRVGKTLLAKKYSENKPSLYLFTSKKTETLLCKEFMLEYENFTQKKHLGEITHFVDLFELLLKHGKNNPFVLVIDEFQELGKTNKSIYSEIQKLWDAYKFETQVHIIFIGSIYSLMIKIFQDEKEPLYGRADRIFYVKPFEPSVIKEILVDNKHYSPENLFYNYLITGGIPRYQEILSEASSYNKDAIMDLILTKDSFFIGEGKNLLIQEFGKEYGIYFSILELIASGRTTRSEIESVLEKSVGGYLERLESDYAVLAKVHSIGAKKGGKNQRYQIKDLFIRFWFRFIYKNISIIENERFEYLKMVIERDLTTYAGHILEKLFIELIGQNPEYGLIGNYWEKGNHNEIDIVAINDLDKKILCCEVKMNKNKINLNILKEKSIALQKRYANYEFIYRALSLEDIDRFFEIR